MNTVNCTSKCIDMDRHMKRIMDMHIRMSTVTNTHMNSNGVLPRQVEHSATGTRTRVARVRAEYPNQLDYSGCTCDAVMRARLRFLVAFVPPVEIPPPGLEPGSLGCGPSILTS